MKKKNIFVGNDRHQPQNKLATKMKLLTHITRNLRDEFGFGIVGPRVLHDIIRTLCFYFTALFSSVSALYSVKVSVKRWKRSKPV